MVTVSKGRKREASWVWWWPWEGQGQGGLQWDPISNNQTTNKQKSENQIEIIIIYPAIRKFWEPGTYQVKWKCSTTSPTPGKTGIWEKSTSLSVHASVPMCTCETCEHVCTCGGQRTTWGAIPQELSPSPWSGAVTSLAWGLLIQFSCPFRECQGFNCLCILRVGTTAYTTMFDFLKCGFWGQNSEVGRTMYDVCVASAPVLAGPQAWRSLLGLLRPGSGQGDPWALHGTV